MAIIRRRLDYGRNICTHTHTRARTQRSNRFPLAHARARRPYTVYLFTHTHTGARDEREREMIIRPLPTPSRRTVSPGRESFIFAGRGITRAFSGRLITARCARDGVRACVRAKTIAVGCRGATGARNNDIGGHEVRGWCPIATTTTTTTTTRSRMKLNAECVRRVKTFNEIISLVPCVIRRV